MKLFELDIGEKKILESSFFENPSFGFICEIDFAYTIIL